MTSTPEVSFLRLELFPAEVTDESSTKIDKTNLKAIVTDSYFLLYTDSPSGPSLYLQEDLVSFAGGPTTGYQAVTPSHTYHIRRANGCGCGSRLRAFRPFRGKPTHPTQPLPATPTSPPPKGHRA